MTCACRGRRYGSIENSKPCSFHLFQTEKQSEDEALNQKSRISEALIVSFLKILYLV